MEEVDRDPSNYRMVVLARESRGLSQSELAGKADLSPALLSKIEGGLRPITAGALDKIAHALDYPTEFFAQTDHVHGAGTNELYHRKRQAIPVRTLTKAYALMNIQRMHLERMLVGVEVADPDIPRFSVSEFGNVADIARTVRARWHLPSGPIENVTSAIEAVGGIIIPFDFGTRQIDAVSQWPPTAPPLFFVNPTAPSDRCRYTLSHELGHMVMHQEDAGPSMEREADQFAAEFLMPERDVRPYLVGVTLSKLIDLKAFWKVSMGALLKRAEDLGSISARHARTLWMQMGKLGYRTQEPTHLPAEPPSLFGQIVEIYKTELGYTSSDFRQLFRVHEEEVRTMYFRRPDGLRMLS